MFLYPNYIMYNDFCQIVMILPVFGVFYEHFVVQNVEKNEQWFTFYVIYTYFVYLYIYEYWQKVRFLPPFGGILESVYLYQL